MKIRFSGLILILMVFALFSCAKKVTTDIPSQYDYNNYLENYSLKVLKGYTKIPEEQKEIIRKKFFPMAPSSTVVFLNNDLKMIFLVYKTGQVKINDYQKTIIFDKFQKSIEKEFSNTESVRSDNSVQISVEMDDGEDKRGMVKLSLVPAGRNSTEKGVFVSIFWSMRSSFKTAKTEFGEMTESLKSLR